MKIIAIERHILAAQLDKFYRILEIVFEGSSPPEEKRSAQIERLAVQRQVFDMKSAECKEVLIERLQDIHCIPANAVIMLAEESAWRSRYNSKGEKRMKTRNLLFNLLSLLVFASLLAACGGAATPAAPATEAPTEAVTEAPATEAPTEAATEAATQAATEAPAANGAKEAMASLLDACKSEGMLTLIATPRSWANYGEIFDLFESQTGVTINSLDENAGSADELAAIEANKDNKGPQAPDIIDVGYAFGDQAIEQGLVQPYKVSTWDAIPDEILGLPAKDPEGNWTGGYYGVMAIETNTAAVQNPPKNWEDLLKPEYKGQVALSGPPTTSNQAQQSIFAAALANGGSLDDAQPGLDFFKQMNDVGNFVPVVAKPGTIAQGATPIVLAWDYLAFGDRDTFAGNPTIEVTYPSPTIASLYVQGISAYAPHPNCAKYWMELLHSDEGQMAWMRGYAHGVNQADMEARGVIPEDLQAKLPESSAYASAVSPNPDQLTAARQLIGEQWLATVGVDVPTPVP